MKRFVALLRGINVGGNKKVPMEQLRAAFADMGFSNVSTYINSGNVIFDAKHVNVDTIEKSLKKRFGFEIRVLVRDAANIKKVAKAAPKEWVNDKAQKTEVLFLWDGYDTKKSLKLLDVNDRVDSLRYVDGAIIWHVDRKDYNKSGMHTFIGTELYKNMTARNINTVRKLTELVQ